VLKETRKEGAEYRKRRAKYSMNLKKVKNL
jgi:hypothetical protein